MQTDPLIGSRAPFKVRRARADISLDMEPEVESLANAGTVDGGATVDVSVLRAVSAMQRELAEVGLDLKAVMQRIADRTRELTGGTSAAVRLLDGDALVCGAVSGAPEIQNPHRLPLGDNLSGHAMRSRRSLLCLDTENDDRVDAQLSRTRGVRSIIAVPLLHGGEAVGLLLLYGDKAGAFSERDVTMMELLSVVLSGAMAHAAEFEAKRDQVEALARFEATFAGALTGMLLMDLDGRIIDSNPAIQSMLGRSDVELAGRRTSEFVHPDDRRKSRAAFLRMIEKGETSLRMQHRFTVQRRRRPVGRRLGIASSPIRRVARASPSSWSRTSPSRRRRRQRSCRRLSSTSTRPCTMRSQGWQTARCSAIGSSRRCG